MQKNYQVNRNFDTLINILGSDHSGYIKRITAAVKAVSKNKTEKIANTDTAKTNLWI